MIDLQSRWKPWAGAAGTSVLAEYLDAKTKPLTTGVSNGELVALGAFAADLFGVGGAKYSRFVTGGSDWAVGSLVGTVLRSRITPPVSTTTTTATASTKPTATFNSGVTGVPTAGYSAAYD